MVPTLCVLIALSAVPCRAEPSIRVLLAQDVKKVLVQGERGIVIRDGKGADRLITGPASIRTTPAGITVNGLRLHERTVTIRSRKGDLTVTLAQTDHRREPIGDSSLKPTVPAPVPVHHLEVSGVVDLIHRPTGLLLVNDVDLEEYVKGVVPGEMNAAWHPEALKVQAIAARTYALYQRMMNAGREYDVIAGTQDQVYRGRHGVDQRVEEAVETTQGLIMTYQDAPILAAFSSTAAGPTEDAMYVWAKDLPYLKGVDCPFDMNSPYYQWRVELPVQRVEQSLRKQGIPVGTIASLTPYLYSPAGRVDKIRILHSEGELILRGQDFRKAVGYSLIPSTQFEVETLGSDAVISGRGSGHAVGLCQWGAKELAEQGYPFETILRYYFPGTELKSWRSIPPIAAAR